MRQRSLVLLLLTALLALPGIRAQTPPRRAAVEVTEASITTLQDAMSRGQVTAEQLVTAYLARIAAYDHTGPGINALIRINPNAMRDARALDAERRAGTVRGPLHGIPVIVKEQLRHRRHADQRRLPRAREHHDPRRTGSS